MEENRLLTDIVAEYCVNFKYEDVPADVKQHIINILFDTVGLMLGGRDLDKGRIGIEFALEMGGGSDDCTLVGTNHRVSAMAAAFGNGELSHTLDGDILLPPAHLSTYIFAAILAEAERLHCTGKQLITAIALGSDIATRVGMSQGSFRIEATEETKNLSRADQMKPIKTYGMGCLSFGAAAAVAWLNGCDKEQMKDALGNTGYFIPNGSHQRFLFGPRPGMQKYSPAGWGNLVGYAGARLAALGCFGDREIFDGDHGWWAMQGTPQKLTEWLTKDLGNYWIVRDVRYKYFPTDGIYQAPCYLVWQLVEENNIKPEDIEHIQLHCEFTCPGYMNKIIEYNTDAAASLPFAIATAANHIKPGPLWSAKETLENPSILMLMDKIGTEDYAECDKAREKDLADGMTFINRRPQMVDITTKDGKTYTKSQEFMPFMSAGHPDYAPTKEQFETKFRNNAEFTLSPEQITNAMQGLWNIESYEDVAEFMKLLVP